MHKEDIEIINKMVKNKKIDYIILAKYISYGLSVWCKMFKEKNYSNAIDENDGYFVVYKAYNETVNIFIKYKLDGTLFLYKFAQQIRNVAKNYMRSFSSRKHLPLNNAISFDQESFRYEIPEEEKQNNNDYSEKIKLMYQLCANDLSKKIIKMRLEGYSNNAISKSLNINKKKIENAIYSLKKRYNNKYDENIINVV